MATNGRVGQGTSPSKLRVVVTGVVGFIGSHLCERLVSEGHEVIGIDNFLTGRVGNLACLAAEPRFDFIEGDVSGGLSVAGELDWVMHFASPASPPKYQRYPIECMRANSEGCRNMLELARSQGAAFFLASTSEVYGDL